MTPGDNKVSANYVFRHLFRNCRPRKLPATSTNANRQTGLLCFVVSDRSAKCRDHGWHSSGSDQAISLTRLMNAVAKSIQATFKNHIIDIRQIDPPNQTDLVVSIHMAINKVITHHL